ncbi:diguanylate cyclase [Lysinibacillus louembei]|uniref:Diguanylate cyclase n=1 Tax=Lysinibacillus louembei TaxID=1470088 RepID=A0ABZ0S391_9BACI|nr:diguanylate cyclase [Lysinibacillus louembei]WPK13791.1 diguanylate cyclase [Lysinibacillus louembei]
MVYKAIIQKQLFYFFILFIFVLLPVPSTYAEEQPNQAVHIIETTVIEHTYNSLLKKDSWLSFSSQMAASPIKERSYTATYLNYAAGIFYGFLLAIAIYHLLLYFSLKEKVYLYYVLFIACFMLYQARQLEIFIYLFFIFQVLFAIQLLALQKHAAHFYRLAKGLIVVIVLTFLLSNMIRIHDAIAIVPILFLLLSGVVILLKNQLVARFYVAGYSVVVIIQLFWGYEAFMIGFPLLALFLAFALGERINFRKRDYQKIQYMLSEEIEGIVQQRTEQLEKKKRELEKLANTDRLTQISNRVQIEKLLEGNFQLAQQQHIPFSIILLDIDDFKAVNDEFGHQVGDITLKEVAKILRNAMTGQNTVGRWGGEEFLILCPQTTLSEAVIIAERLREQLASYSFPVVKQKTGSFGVASYMENDSLDSLLLRSDKALYQAKKCGRNCVEFIMVQREPATSTGSGRNV